MPLNTHRYWIALSYDIPPPHYTAQCNGKGSWTFSFCSIHFLKIFFFSYFFMVPLNIMNYIEDIAYGTWYCRMLRISRPLADSSDSGLRWQQCWFRPSDFSVRPHSWFLHFTILFIIKTISPLWNCILLQFPLILYFFHRPESSVTFLQDLFVSYTIVCISISSRMENMHTLT